MWSNLHLAGMNFEEFCDDEESPPDDEGWYQAGQLLREDDSTEGEDNSRDEGIARFEIEGKALPRAWREVRYGYNIVSGRRSRGVCCSSTLQSDLCQDASLFLPRLRPS